MRNLFIAILVLAMAPVAFAKISNPVQSLNDLPNHWEGFAGDLLMKVPATLNIDKVLKVKRNDTQDGIDALYDVEANLTMGKRVLHLKQVGLRSYSEASGIYELSLYSDDELVSVVIASVKYDEVGNSYTLSELPVVGGEHRVVLHAAARAQ